MSVCKVGGGLSFTDVGKGSSKRRAKAKHLEATGMERALRAIQRLGGADHEARIATSRTRDLCPATRSVRQRYDLPMSGGDDRHAAALPQLVEQVPAPTHGLSPLNDVPLSQ